MGYSTNRGWRRKHLLYIRLSGRLRAKQSQCQWNTSIRHRRATRIQLGITLKPMSRKQRKRLKKKRRLEMYRRKPRKKLPRGYSRHHRRCRANNGGDDSSNISIVRDNKHRAFHLLFGSMTPQQIAEELNRTWIESSVRLVVV
jgi:hypothetical protein